MPSPALELPSLSIFSDGTISRAPYCPPPVPASETRGSDEALTKDLTINAAHGTWARLFLPRQATEEEGQAPNKEMDVPKKDAKLPILLYFHGGAFLLKSTALPEYHNFLSKLARQASVLIVSIEYRLAPEHRLPCAYNDGIDALSWLIDQAKGAAGFVDGWLESYADFSRVFMGGDSAGANLAHHVAVRGASPELKLTEGGAICLRGIVSIHPFFSSEALTEREAKMLEVADVVRKIWRWCLPEEIKEGFMDHPYACPASCPSHAGDLAALPPVLVLVAGSDFLRDKGVAYFEALKSAGNECRLWVSEGEPHVFHLLSPSSASVPALMEAIVSFIKDY